jgi:hypothetical protein
LVGESAEGNGYDEFIDAGARENFSKYSGAIWELDFEVAGMGSWSNLSRI